MRAKTTNPRKSTSSFSNREKMRRNPFGRRNSRSTPLRRLYIRRSYSQGPNRVLRGGTTGSNPNLGASWACLVALACPVHQQRQLLAPGSQAMEQLATLGRIMGLSGRQRERHRRSSIRGNQTNPGGPSPGGLADGLWTVFVARPSRREEPSRGAVHRNRLSLDPGELLLLEVFEHPAEDPVLRLAIHPGADGVPPPEPRR